MNTQTYAERKKHFKDCGLILGFMKEFDMPYDKQSLDFVYSLYNSSYEEMSWWKKSKFRREWLKEIQSVTMFPSIEDLLSVKEVLLEAIHQDINELRNSLIS